MKIFYLPDLGEGLADAEIQEWYVKAGDTVEVDQPLVSMETAKAVVDVPAPFAGTVEKLFGAVGDTIDTDAALIGFIDEHATAKHEDKGTVVGNIETSNVILEEQVSISETTLTATPGKRALARRRGVTVDELTKNRRVNLQSIKKTASATDPLPEGYQRIPRVRRAMVNSMAHAHETIAAVTIVDDADIHAWHGKGDITLRVIRAIAHACSVEPIMHASFDAEHMAYHHNEHVNVGIAVDAPHGLFVPVLHNVDQKTDAELREQINQLKQHAKDKSFSPEALQGATISLSNFGMIAGRYGTPMIVAPMVSIVGIGKLRDNVIAIEGDIVIHKTMPISISLDHRAVTGGEATRFLGAMIHALEKP